MCLCVLETDLVLKFRKHLTQLRTLVKSYDFAKNLQLILRII